MKNKRESQIYTVTLIGSIVNFLLVAVKFLVGILGHSAAMVADAVHSLSDFITDVIVIVFVRISSKPEDDDHDYGHGKYETLATALVGICLFAVGIALFYGSAVSVYDFIRGGTLPEPDIWVLWVALLSIVAKEMLYRYTAYKGKKLNSPAVVANAWHHRSDALSSLGVAIGIGGALLLGGNWRVLDPLAAMAVSVFIMKVAVELLKPCMDELLEKSLPAEVEKQIVETILSVDGVSSPHHLRTRKIGNYCSIDVHVRMDGSISLKEAHDSITEVENRLRERFGRDTVVNIHFEPLKQ